MPRQQAVIPFPLGTKRLSQMKVQQAVMTAGDPPQQVLAHAEESMSSEDARSGGLGVLEVGEVHPSASAMGTNAVVQDEGSG